MYDKRDGLVKPSGPGTPESSVAWPPGMRWCARARC